MSISLETYHALRQKLGFTDNLPYSKDWSAAADFLELIADYCLATQPRTIVECSSGLSTLILARCCEMNQCGKVTSLENGKEYASNTRKTISQYALDDYATIIDAPLCNMQIQGNDYQWYQTTKNSLANIDLLIIDGPNGYIQKNSRYPALPILHPFFAEQCTVFLDDAAREDEQEIVAQWQQQYQPVGYEYIKTERGCAVLKF